ncbi:MAG: aminotransferase class I/II-fold pyridoxal phosphate-dependent enzyme [Lachnospiraceae bacterium]|nr:aminotransferase class I/II-fold pyridoxal phosphate-dependent enzyme [Lachnospiraceae bacterium]
MVAFQNDYIAGAHPEILKKLVETNLESLPGYGSDHYCDSAKEKIKDACGCPDAEVEFLVGGTQSNAIIVSTMIQEYEGVVAATTGHVSVHESGAIEYSGHKVLTVPPKNGKIEADSLRHFLEVFYADGTQEHMVYPGMVYISHPTEYGTLYTKAELEGIAAVCHEYKMPLFLDGARLGYGLMSYDTDVTLQDIARICDVFYIGGTKVGALCGEAVVFTKGNKPAHFENRIKKRGALLAKGRLLGIQFDTLFTDDLYFKISRHAIDMAEKMKAIVREKGYDFFIDSPTNQQFVILKNSDMERIAEKVVFSVWEPVDEDRTAVRFATSWATTDEDLAALKEAL